MHIPIKKPAKGKGLRVKGKRDKNKPFAFGPAPFASSLFSYQRIFNDLSNIFFKILLILPCFTTTNLEVIQISLLFI